jgi:RNA polymerase sigma factor (sigma-70 family)
MEGREPNKVIREFLGQEEYHKLYESYLKDPHEKNKTRLETAFKRFFRHVRFVAYLNKAIYYESRKFDMKVRELRTRYQLTLDQPAAEAEGGAEPLTQLLEDESALRPFMEIPSGRLEDYTADPRLAKLIKGLTPRQQEILFYAFVRNLPDAETARLLGISPQAVSKTKNKAIESIRRNYHV